MSFDGGNVVYRYHPNQRNERGITDDWIIDSFEVHLPSSHGYDTHVSSVMPMRRFIDEPDCIPFVAATQPDTATLPSFQSLDIAPYAYPTSMGWPNSLGAGLVSPPPSGPSSSYFSSCASDRQSTPLSPPDSGFMTWSPEIAHAEHFGLPFGGGRDLLGEQKPALGYSCVAMHEIQSYEDPQPEKLAYDDDTAYYGSYASAPHEGYHPVEAPGEPADSGVETDDNDSKDDDYTPLPPNLRRRRPQAARAVLAPRTPSKVTKRSGHTRRPSTQHVRSRGNRHSGNNAAAPRAFPCALANYGCTSTFGSKNEWKRHVNTQHMRLGYWRCDQCGDNRKPNDFNRKDLFIQHVRRMHPVKSTAATSKKSSKHTDKPAKGSAEDQVLNSLAERCFQRDRAPPDQSGCHFCDAAFEDTKNADHALWDKRLEHVAQHMENAKNSDDAGPADPSSWRVDERLHRWLVENRIITKDGGRGGFVLV